MKAYKFLSSRFAESFASGSVRISPAFTFRKNDGLIDGRNDPNELIHETDLSVLAPDGGEVTLDTDHPVYPHGMFHEVRGGVRRELSFSVTASLQSDVDQGLLFCCSCSATDTIIDRMQATFGADALFEISDIQEFAETLSSHWFLLDRLTHADKVQYLEDHSRRMSIIPPSPLFKSKAFEWQDEFRIVWSQFEEEQAFNIAVPEISKLLKRVY